MLRPLQAPCAARPPDLTPTLTPTRRLPVFWYWIGNAHASSIRATTEDAARTAILELFPPRAGPAPHPPARFTYDRRD